MNSPMSNPLSPQQNRIIQIHIRIRPISQRLARMEDKRNLYPEIFLLLYEVGEGNEVVGEWAEGVFVAYEVES